LEFEDDQGLMIHIAQTRNNCLVVLLDYGITLEPLGSLIATISYRHRVLLSVRVERFVERPTGRSQRLERYLCAELCHQCS
jgi:hypothetical protein